MPSLPLDVSALYNAKVNSINIRYVTFPAAAAGVAMVSDGAAAAWAWAAYVQIVAAATIADPSWLTAVLIAVGAVETHYGDYAVASGGAGAEVDIAYIPYAIALPGVGGLPTWVASQPAVTLPYPVCVRGAPRLAGRLRKSTAASAAGFTTKVQLAQSVGS